MGLKRVRIPPDGLPFGRRVGVQDPTSTIQTGPDGVEKRRPASTTSLTHLGKLTPVNLESHIDVTAAMQIAVYNVLTPMVMYKQDLTALVDTGGVSSGVFAWKEVVFDFPEPGKQEQPIPSAVILPNTETTYGYQSLETSLLEDTIDAYAPGTVLRKIATASQSLAVYTLSAHKEERRAIKAAFERTFLTEPDDDQQGRRVVVSQYYDRETRITFRSMDYQDTSASDQANKFVSVALFDTTSDVVMLVKRPELVQVPVHSLDLGIGVSTDP